MIFFDNQLMKSDVQLTLFLVSNPIAFERYEDHEAALQIQLHELVEQAIQHKENPIAMIEDYLKISYSGGQSPAEIANFLMHSPPMSYAFQALKENWINRDVHLPEDSLMYGGVSKTYALGVFSEITLHSYLEALSQVFDDQQ